MPRDIHIASPRPLVFGDLVAAGAEVDETLAVRGLFHGSVLQLVDVSDAAVLTIENSRQLVDPADARRIAPTLALPQSELWWIEATAPWGPAGASGVAIGEALTRILGGTMVCVDGT